MRLPVLAFLDGQLFLRGALELTQPSQSLGLRADKGGGRRGKVCGGRHQRSHVAIQWRVKGCGWGEGALELAQPSQSLVLRGRGRVWGLG